VRARQRAEPAPDPRADRSGDGPSLLSALGNARVQRLMRSVVDREALEEEEQLPGQNGPEFEAEQGLPAEDQVSGPAEKQSSGPPETEFESEQGLPAEDQVAGPSESVKLPEEEELAMSTIQRAAARSRGFESND